MSDNPELTRWATQQPTQVPPTYIDQAVAGYDPATPLPIGPTTTAPTVTTPTKPTATSNSLPYEPPADKKAGKAAFEQAAFEARKDGYVVDTTGETLKIYKWIDTPGTKPTREDFDAIDGITDAEADKLYKDALADYTSGKGGTKKKIEIDPSTDPTAAVVYNAWLGSMDPGSGSSSGGGSGGSSGAGGAAAAYVKADATDENSRRLKDFLTRYDALYDAYEREQSYQMKANQNNMAITSSWASGAGDWENPYVRMVAGDMPGDPISGMIQPTIPDFLTPDYQRATPGLDGVGFNDSNFTSAGYPVDDWESMNYGGEFWMGTDIPAFAGGTDAPAPWMPGYYQPGQYPWSIPANTSGTAAAAPGQKNSNQYLPSSQWQFGGQDYDSLALTTMVQNIENGRTGLQWNGPDLSQWAGTTPPQQVTAALAQWIREHPNDPQVTYMMGGPRPSDRSNAYVDAPQDPNVVADNARADEALALQKQQYALSVQQYLDKLNATQGGGYSGGGGGGGGAYQSRGPTYVGAYSSGGAEGDPDLEKKLAVQYAQLKLQEELQKWQMANGDKKMELDQQQAIVDAAYKQALTQQISDSHDLDLMKFAAQQEMDEFARDLQTKSFEEQKRQFDLTQQDKAAERQIARGKIIADYGAGGGQDALAKHFFVHGQAAPVGEAFDIFTGESRGMKTNEQAQIEDTPLYLGQQSQPKYLSSGTMPGYTTAPIFVTGDPPPKKKGGYPELLFNPTRAPIRVLSHEQTKQVIP